MVASHQSLCPKLIKPQSLLRFPLQIRQNEAMGFGSEKSGAPLLSGRPGKRGGVAEDNRRFINAVSPLDFVHGRPMAGSATRLVFSGIRPILLGKESSHSPPTLRMARGFLYLCRKMP